MEVFISWFSWTFWISIEIESVWSEEVCDSTIFRIKLVNPIWHSCTGWSWSSIYWRILRHNTFEFDHERFLITWIVLAFLQGQEGYLTRSSRKLKSTLVGHFLIFSNFLSVSWKWVRLVGRSFWLDDFRDQIGESNL